MCFCHIIPGSDLMRENFIKDIFFLMKNTYVLELAQSLNVSILEIQITNF